MSLNHHDSIPLEEKVDIKTKLCYAVGSFGSYTVFTIFLNSVIIFYREKLLLQSSSILYAFTLYTILNAINGVIFGWISDRTRTRKGRRIPYLKYLAPFLALSFILIWISPLTREIGELGVFFWLLLTMIFFDICYNTTNMAYSALGQELSMDNKERVNIQVYIMIFGIFSTLISLILPLSFLEDPGREGFIIFVVLLALIQLLTMWITAFTIKERLEFSQIDEPLGIIESFRYTIRNKSFLSTVFVNFCVGFVQAVIFGNIFFFINYIYINYPSALILALIGIFLLSGLFLGTIFLLKLNKARGLKYTLLRSLAIIGIGLIMIGVLPDIFATFGFFLFGFGLFGFMGLPNTALGAVADEDEVNTGTRREAAIFGVSALITKPAQSLAGLFIALILLLFQYQEPINGVQQPQSVFTLLGFRLGMGIIPGIIVLVSVYVFSFYPLYGEYLVEIKIKMYDIHEEKKKKLESLKIKN